MGFRYVNPLRPGLFGKPPNGGGGSGGSGYDIGWKMVRWSPAYSYLSVEELGG